MNSTANDLRNPVKLPSATLWFQEKKCKSIDTGKRSEKILLFWSSPSCFSQQLSLMDAQIPIQENKLVQTRKHLRKQYLRML